MIRIGISVLLLCVISSAASADKNKSEFNLFNPTPLDLLREFNTDRPDKTESPYTVDAGHMQLEMDLANYSYDRRNPQHEARRDQTLNILCTKFKVVLRMSLDVQRYSIHCH